MKGTTMPAWGESLIRVLMLVLAGYLQTQGHTALTLGAVGGAAVGDLPFRATSTGASEGRKTEAQAVVAAEVKSAAKK